jgi:hypothetical protein
MACLEATKLADRFPTPSQIRAALKRLEGVPSTRPDYLDEAIAPESERWTEETRAFSNEARAKLGLPPAPPVVAAEKDGRSEGNS